MIASMGVVESIAVLGVMGCLGFVSWTDVWSRKIPNLATYSLGLTGLIWGAAISFHPSPQLLVDSFLGSLAGLIVSFSIMFVIYAYTNSGAGDVKLAAGIGAFLGIQGGLLTICYAYITAACFASCLLIWMFGFGYVARSSLRVLKLWPYPEDPAIEERANSIMSQGLPLAPFFLIGTILTIFDLPSFR